MKKGIKKRYRCITDFGRDILRFPFLKFISFGSILIYFCSVSEMVGPPLSSFLYGPIYVLYSIPLLFILIRYYRFFGIYGDITRILYPKTYTRYEPERVLTGHGNGNLFNKLYRSLLRSVRRIPKKIMNGVESPEEEKNAFEMEDRIIEDKKMERRTDRDKKQRNNTEKGMKRVGSGLTDNITEKMIKKVKLLEEREMMMHLMYEDMKNEVFMIAHDLKSPLISIKGYTDIIKRIIGKKLPDDTKIIYYLDRINRNVENLLEIVSKMTDNIKKRWSVGEPQINRDRVNVLAEIKDIISVFSEILKNKGINVSFVNMEEVPVITTDRIKFRHIFQNLISNAIQYMGDGPEKKIIIGYRRMEKNFPGTGERGGRVHLFWVKDTGIGIPPDNASRIFSKFPDINRGYNRDDRLGGIGLGLYLVKQNVEKMGGRIWFESEVGKGTTFYVALPQTTEGTSE